MTRATPPPRRRERSRPVFYRLPRCPYCGGYRYNVQGVKAAKPPILLHKSVKCKDCKKPFPLYGH